MSAPRDVSLHAAAHAGCRGQTVSADLGTGNALHELTLVEEGGGEAVGQVFGLLARVVVAGSSCTVHTHGKSCKLVSQRASCAGLQAERPQVGQPSQLAHLCGGGLGGGRSMLGGGGKLHAG